MSTPSLLDRLKESTISSEQVFAGHLLTIFRDTVQLPDGQHGQREYVQHPGAVMIIPQFEDGSFLMEHQYRYPFHQVMLEFPAGKMEAGEETLETAQRELEEETGYCAKRWHYLTSFHPIVSYTTETIHCYLAQDLYATQARPDEGEFIETLTLSAQEALQGVQSGAIRDGKTILAILWLAQWGTSSCQPL
jgi:ADP-ribose pyrophosphatase